MYWIWFFCSFVFFFVVQEYVFTNVYFYFSDFFYESPNNSNSENVEGKSESENEEQILRVGKEFDSWDEYDCQKVFL